MARKQRIEAQIVSKYQIATRMVDRWAAVNMSAGHPNGVGLRNLASLPIALQVGTRDTKDGRNDVTVQMNERLNELAREYPGYDTHTTWFHDTEHNFADNDQAGSLQVILDNGVPRQVNTNAVYWINQFQRNPRPARMIWDLKTRANRQAETLWHHGMHGQQQYWIDIGKNDTGSLGVDTIIVSLEKDNRINVEKCGRYLRLLIDTTMLNFGEEVKIVVDGITKSLYVQTSPEVQKETLKQRGDPRYIFDASITIERTSNGGWILKLNELSDTVR